MRVAMFCHSLLSDWNHGNAHFLRGVVTDLVKRGHAVHAFEPEDAWSAQNLARDYGEEAVRATLSIYPWLAPHRYCAETLDLDEALDHVDLVLIHEWNDPALVKRIGEHRRRSGRYRLFFHDTHHRSVTAPESMGAYDLSDYDGVLTFGEVVREIYVRRGWASRAFTWHEAADTRVFHPRPVERPEGDLVWIGNWGDEERTAELHEFLLDPARELELRAKVHGVRYPDHGRRALAEHGVAFGGWIANYRVPDVFARYLFTAHVPRRPYAESLPGIPTIRPFEAMACGIPLVSSPWADSEGLFSPGKDFLVARNGTEMKRHFRMLREEAPARRELAERALATIRARHTCTHRVNELIRIVAFVGLAAPQPAG